MDDEYKPQPGQCCGECREYDRGDAPSNFAKCGLIKMHVAENGGHECALFTRREEPKPVEPVTVTFERDDDPRYVVVSPGAFHWYRPELHAALLRIAAGPVTVQIPPAPCGECAGLRNEATKAKCDLTVAETARDLARAEAAKLREVIRFANDREGERTSAMSQVVKERDAARAEAEALRAQPAERDAEIERLREILKRVSTKVDSIGELADELELQVACMDLTTTRGDV